MKSFLLMVSVLFITLFLWTAPARPGMCPGVTTPLSPLGIQRLVVAGSVVSLTVPRGSRLAVIEMEVDTGADLNAGLRFRDDGTNPTGAQGMRMHDGASIVVCGPSLGGFKIIRDSSLNSSDIVINVYYYGG